MCLLASFNAIRYHCFLIVLFYFLTFDCVVIKFLFVLFSSLDDIIMLDEINLHQIPSHLQRVLSDRNLTSLDVLNALAYAVALECGFVSDRVDLNSFAQNYAYTWYYSFDKRVFDDCQFEHFASKMSLKFVMNQSINFSFECIGMGDFVLMIGYENTHSKVENCKSVLLPISRYLPYKKLMDPLPNSFRNIKELSHKLKRDIFHPLRNEIYERSNGASPCLNGMPEPFLIYKYLDTKSKRNLSQTCKTQHINLLNFKRFRK